jgi:hypothetical protein
MSIVYAFSCDNNKGCDSLSVFFPPGWTMLGNLHFCDKPECQQAYERAKERNKKWKAAQGRLRGKKRKAREGKR